MRKSKVLALVLGLVLVLGGGVFALTGCGTKEYDLVIGIVTSPSSIQDGSFNQNCYEGMKLFKAEMEKQGKSVELKSKQQTSTDWAPIKKDLQDMAEVCDYVICPGFQFAGVSEIADSYKDTKFILIDTEPTAAKDNIASFTFAEQESGFLAGVAASMETETGKVGFVGGMTFPSVNNYGYGFAAGVKYASDKNLAKPGVTLTIPSFSVPEVGGPIASGAVNVSYVNDFNNEAGGKTAGEALYAGGCDIIFVAAGASGNGVFAAAKEQNKKVIGCDTDQYNDGKNGSSNIVLTSALKKLDNVVLAALKDEFVKGHKVMNATKDATGYVKASGRQQLAAATITKLDEVLNLIKTGKIVPSTTDCTYTEVA